MNMKPGIMIMVIFTLLITASAPSPAAPASRCEDTDTVCREFEQLTGAGRVEKIVAQYETAGGQAYSEGSRSYIGQAYLALASRDDISPELEERCYLNALKLNCTIAYMGLYFFHAQKDEEKALGFLREYVKTKPLDTVPFVILGEAELARNNYEIADSYLREAKRVAHAYSPRVDWLLFKANYLLRNYQFASEMFMNAVTKGKFESEIKALSADPRFEGIEMRPEFNACRSLFKLAKSGN
jgi:tetratricopeptide (TPR) repeat protein